jgi:hypothetical protein
MVALLTLSPKFSEPEVKDLMNHGILNTIPLTENIFSRQLNTRK